MLQLCKKHEGKWGSPPSDASKADLSAWISGKFKEQKNASPAQQFSHRSYSYVAPLRRYALH